MNNSTPPVKNRRKSKPTYTLKEKILYTLASPFVLLWAMAPTMLVLLLLYGIATTVREINSPRTCDHLSCYE